MHGAGLQPGTHTIVAAVGHTWKTKLVRSQDDGVTWSIVDDETRNNLFVAFHPMLHNIVYAGNKKSTNGGETFKEIAFLKEKNADILGMCRSRPDTLYAMDKTRTCLFRSDDQGATWRQYAKPGWALCRHDSKPTFAVDPADCDRVYGMDAQGDLARFDGKTWESLGLLARAGGSARPKNFVRAVAADAKQPGILYAGMHAPGTETLWRSTDSGATWSNITFNLPRLSVSSININPHSGEVMVGGCCGTWVLPPPYASGNRVYDKLVSMPSCHDGLKNGTEQGADCGSGCSEACN
jgi:photosystem II stability/assembly factor-like uncharacterized protein